jgi:hypothetical protein
MMCSPHQLHAMYCCTYCCLQIGSELFPGVVRQLWGAAAEQEWLDLQQLCR